jgi:hypothetical protein
MKKLLTLLTLAILLTGCATKSNESFLDKKIKCKKLAEARIEELRTDCVSCSIHEGYSNYSSTLDTCLINYGLSRNGQSIDNYYVRRIEDIISNRTIAEFISNSEDILGKEKEAKFESQLKLYFGEDAE